MSVSADPKGIDLYARFCVAGAACCGLTHGAMTPVDVVKTRIQLDPAKYKGGLFGAGKQIIKAEGAGALLTGFGPTVAGYSIQGMFKFGGYEFWKSTIVSSVGMDVAIENRTKIYLVSAGCAEFFADVALCPLEATRIRLVSQPSFANGLVGGFTRLLKEEGIIRGFYSGFIPILFKQIPYTMAKFVVYEKVAETVYDVLEKQGKPKESMSPGTITGINLGSGLVAGIAAAIISQPADTMLSKVNKTAGEGGMLTRLAGIAKDLGPRGLFLGTPARCVMVGGLTAGQFAIYGDVKRVLGATGGTDIPKN